MRILFVVTHPHDFIHCAATCGIHAQRGDAVTVVSVTDGAGAHNEQLYDELLKPEQERDMAIINQSYEEFAAIKADEFNRVCAVFGVEDVRIFPYSEPYRMDWHRESVETLRQIICELCPDVMVTHRPYLRGRHGMVSAARDSHEEVAFAAHEAMDLAAAETPQDEHAPHTIGATYYLGGGFSEQDVIDFYVETSTWYDKIVEAEMIFESQGHDEAFSRRRVEAESGIAGWCARTRYAEDFQRSGPELFNALPVPREALHRARGGNIALMNRMSGTLKADDQSPPPAIEQLRIMAITAHPHDFTHCAATCGIHAARGDSVTVVCLTDGLRQFDETKFSAMRKLVSQQDHVISDQSDDDRSAINMDALRRACGLFGVEDVRFLSYPEPFRMDRTPEACDVLAQIIAEAQPDVLLMHRTLLSGRSGMVSAARNDHDEAAFVTWDAMMVANRPDYRTMRRPHEVAAVYFPGVYFEADQIDLYVDISDWVDKRIEAEKLLQSGADNDEIARRCVMIETGHSGMAVGVTDAEGFVCGSLEVYDQLPVPASALKCTGKAHPA